MTRRGQNRSVLAGIYILILCLVFLGQDPENSHHFALLLWPLIILAGYWEDTPGALTVTVLSAITAVAGSLLGLISHAAAAADVIAMGLIFGLTMMLNRDWEARLKAHKAVRTPREKDLAKVERKARLIREQLEEYESRLKDLIKLYEGAKRLLGILELHPMLAEARSVVAQNFPRHFGPQADGQVRLAFYIPEEETNNFQKAEARGHEISDVGFPEKLASSDLHWEPDKILNPLRVGDMMLDSRLKVLAGNIPFHSLMIIPLIMHEREIGIMMLASYAVSAFSAVDFNQAEILGKQIVFALRKTLLYHKVQTLSITDSQTGLFVHRHFQERLQEEIRRAERYNQFLSLIMLDLDHFKRINDEYGHQVGDAVLSETAARLEEKAGSTALVARYGGEEFAVLLPNTPKAKALQIAKAINSFIKVSFIDVGGVHLNITVSVGVSTYPEDALEQEALITAADQALYEAKRNGRDLVMAFTPSFDNPAD